MKPNLAGTAACGLMAGVLMGCATHTAEERSPRWTVSGANRISLAFPDGDYRPYADDIEMAGRRVAAIVAYSIDEQGQLALERKVFFPQLHQYKPEGGSWFHDYRAYLQDTYEDDILPTLYVNNERFVPGPVGEVVIAGWLRFEHGPSPSGLALCRTLYPSMDERMFCEVWMLTNTTNTTLRIASGNTLQEFVDFGAKGKFTRRVVSTAPEHIELKPGQQFDLSIGIMAIMDDEDYPKVDSSETFRNRHGFLGRIAGSLQLETPNPALNTLFGFSKIRAAESIYESELGLIHSPGGGRYYVGIWANDEAEYAGPFFPYLGYDIGIESAMNCYRAFAGEMNPEYEKIRYAFEIEGIAKPFLKDRGDAAMIAFGAAQFALANGDRAAAEELWPLIEWCLEYCRRQLNEEGVVRSESDEMEGRIETGDANLSTSCLYYGALNHAVDLARELDKSGAELYAAQATALRDAIENYFGATVEGLHTYKYYQAHDRLRHWICLPLVVGIHDRAEGTVDALFDRLWTDNGVQVEKNNDDPRASGIFWDRGTLYALRGAFMAGATDRAMDRLVRFSERRLLGDRVPYVVEASPEGNMAHLSAESALYCRVFIEGLFGFKPTGFRSFDLAPRLPSGWDAMALRNIRAFDGDFDIEVRRMDGRIFVRVSNGGSVVLDEGINEVGTVHVSLE